MIAHNVTARERSNCVARKVQTLYIDDIDGSDAEGTVRFGLDGADYEIDLRAARSQALLNSLQKFIARGRKVGGARWGGSTLSGGGAGECCFQLVAASVTWRIGLSATVPACWNRVVRHGKGKLYRSI